MSSTPSQNQNNGENSGEGKEPEQVDTTPVQLSGMVMGSGRWFGYDLQEKHVITTVYFTPKASQGKKVPYFPKEGSLCPHRSGVDYTFENEDEEYRASFLIRGYRTSFDGKPEDHPTYLWEDMFGECKCAKGGLKIKWVNEPVDDSLGVHQEDRVRLNRRDGSKDTKPWRFIKNDK